MDVFSVLMLLGGLAFFLFGMNTMSGGLEKLAGSKLEGILKKLTSNPVKSLFLGIGVTAVIQSSSAVTVMLVGLVNSGIIALSQSIGVIMGANIGTTVTAWLLSLAGIESSNLWIKMLKPENFSLALAMIGIILIMLSKKNKHKDIGMIFVGFAVLMYGMKMMSEAVDPLKESPVFTGLMTAFKSPFLGILAGAVITAVIQSSSASVGILQAIALTGGLSFGAAIPIIMGQNIGTCITAVISGIGVNRSAKRVSVVHLCFNLIGTTVCLILFYGANAIFGFSFLDDAISPLYIAIIHSIFNIFTTCILLPTTKGLEKIANFVIRDKQDARAFSFLDERLLTTPSIAAAQCTQKVAEMAGIAREAMNDAMDLLAGKFNASDAEKVVDAENTLDLYEDKLGSYLVKLSSRELSAHESEQVSKNLHTIGDLERIGDHAANLVQSAEELYQKGLSFSEMAMDDLVVLMNAVREIMGMMEKAYAENDAVLAQKVEPLEQVIDELAASVKNRHIDRLIEGNCTIEMGFILSDLLTNCERVSDHCSNIAIAVIETNRHVFGAHEYLDKLNGPEFDAMYREYAKKYQLA